MQTDMEKEIEIKEEVLTQLLLEGEINETFIDHQYSKRIQFEEIKQETADIIETENTSEETGFNLIETEPPRKMIKYEEELNVETCKQSAPTKKGNKSDKKVKQCSKGKRQTQKPRTEHKMLRERGAKPGSSVKVYVDKARKSLKRGEPSPITTAASSGNEDDDLSDDEFDVGTYELLTETAGRLNAGLRQLVIERTEPTHIEAETRDFDERVMMQVVHEEEQCLADEVVTEDALHDDVVQDVNASVATEGEVSEDTQQEGVINEDMIDLSQIYGSVSTDFQWSEDFSSFTGQKELYLRNPGPTFNSQDPCNVFLQIWDETVMRMIAEQTNMYAEQHFSQVSDPDVGGSFPKYLDKWHNVTVEELYRYFAILIYMSICVRANIQEYWSTGILGMSDFRKIMPRDTFLLITKYLNFVSNSSSSSGSAYERKIRKVAPVLDHCNKKFSELYIPEQHLSLDESLLLWKGRLSWRQCIRSKAARFGIKSFELCEASTGYLLQCKLYAGKDNAMHAMPLYGFVNKTAKVVLQLMEGYLDVGHVLVMDNWYNQLHLARFLKSRHTDVLGTINRGRVNIPHEIKDLRPTRVARGEVVARHCGDLALVAWKDVKLVTVMSTYHKHEMVPGTRAGQAVMKPAAVKSYNTHMGGVDLKDQKVSMYLFERKRGKKWYMKVFKRLLNTSLLNAYIIYTKNPTFRTLSHREFRMKVAEQLLQRFPHAELRRVSSQAISNWSLRLQPGKHFPIRTEVHRTTLTGVQHKKQRCLRCNALKKRTLVTLQCRVCQVPLCVGKCWNEYHEREDLSTTD